MKQTRLIPIILVTIILLNCILPIVPVNAAGPQTISLNSKLYTAIKNSLESQEINAYFNDYQRTITIEEEEIQKVTQMDLSNSAISDISGLDMFKNLSSLDLSSNELDSKTDLSILNNLNLTKLDLSTNKIEDVSSIVNLHSINELNLHNQKFTRVEVIQSEKDEDGEVVKLKEKYPLPQIIKEAGTLNVREWFKEVKMDEDSLLDVSVDISNLEQKDEVASADVKVVTPVEVDGVVIGYTLNQYLTKLEVRITDALNPIAESEIDIYYLVLNSKERASIFKDKKFYDIVKKQLTKGTNDINEELRTYEGGENLYIKAYDEPMIMVFDIDTLINDIPSLNLANVGISDLSGLETFVGLKSDLNIYKNYIDTIENILDLQNNKNTEEILLQERFKKQAEKVKKAREKLVQTLNEIEKIQKEINKSTEKIEKETKNLEAYNDELIKLTTEKEEKEALKLDVERELNKLKDELDEAKKELEKEESNLTGTESDLVKAQKELEEAEATIVKLEEHAEKIEAIDAKEAMEQKVSEIDAKLAELSEQKENGEIDSLAYTTQALKLNVEKTILASNYILEREEEIYKLGEYEAKGRAYYEEKIVNGGENYDSTADFEEMQKHYEDAKTKIESETLAAETKYENAEATIENINSTKTENSEKLEIVKAKIKSLETSIAAKTSEVSKISSEITDKTKKIDELKKKIETAQKTINDENAKVNETVTNEDGNQTLSLALQLENYISKGNGELADLVSTLKILHQVYTKEYRAESILPVEVYNMTKEEYVKFGESNGDRQKIKAIYDSIVSEILKLEQSRGLSDTEKAIFDSKISIPKTNEKGEEIQNPYSTALKSDEEWGTLSYKIGINELVNIDLEIRIANYFATYKKYDNAPEIIKDGKFTEYANILLAEFAKEFISDNKNSYESEVLKSKLEISEKHINYDIEFVEEIDVTKVPTLNAEEIEKIGELYFDLDLEDTTALTHVLGISKKLVDTAENANKLDAYVILSALKKLNLGTNDIEDISGLQILSKLEELDLSDNALTTATLVDANSTNALSSLEYLEVLDLSYNFIDDITSLENMENLEYLSVAKNILKGEMNFDISGLKNIKELDFSENAYTDISSLVNYLDAIAYKEKCELEEYLQREDTVNLKFHNQMLTVDANMIVKNLDTIYQEIELPKIISQFNQLDYKNTKFGINALNGRIDRKGDVSLHVINEEGVNTGYVIVESESWQNTSIGEGTICKVNYTIELASVENVGMTGNTASDTTGEGYKVVQGESLKFNVTSESNNVNQLQNTYTWTVKRLDENKQEIIETEENKTTTSVAADGTLSVDKNETAKYLEVTVTSDFDKTQKATTLVEVVGKIFEINVLPDITNGDSIEQGISKEYAISINTNKSNANYKVEIISEEPTKEGTKVEKTENGIKVTIAEDEKIGNVLKVKLIAEDDESLNKEFTITVQEAKVPVTVTIAGQNTIITKGTETRFSANVIPQEEGKTIDPSVKWTISGAQSSTTTIDEKTGKLIVAAEETAKKLIVTATSNYDSRKFVAKEITIVEPITISINGADSIKKEGDSAVKNNVYSVTIETQATEANVNSINWTISDNTVATITANNDGTITLNPIKSGEVTITATSAYNPNCATSKKVNVEVITVSPIKKPTKDDVVFEPTPGTTVSDFVTGLVNAGHTTKIVDAGNKEVSSAEKLTTGMKVIVDNETTYTVVVKGDINGDGKVDSRDSAMMKEYRLGNLKLDKAQIEAADINGDEKVNRIDTFIMLLYRAGSKDVRDFSTETIEKIMK